MHSNSSPHEPGEGLEAVTRPTQLRASTSEGDMINSSYIFALSEPQFVKRQLRRAFCGGDCERRTSFWRGWGLDGS